MEKLTIADLKKVQEKRKKETALKADGHTVKITVHLGTCGIAAGGDAVLEALTQEIELSQRKDIKVVISGCMGMCSSEPNVTIRRIGEDGVLYRDLDPTKIRQVYQGHVLNGEVQSEFALARIK